MKHHRIRRVTQAQTFPPLCDAEQQALIDFAKNNGRLWKARLSELWARAAAEPVLHRLRNTHGPDWLRTVPVNPPDERGAKRAGSMNTIDDTRLADAIKAEIATLRKAGFSKAYICERSSQIERRVRNRLALAQSEDLTR